MAPMVRTNTAVLNRHGGKPSTVCSFWLAGRCTRNPCKFLHSDTKNPRIAKPQTPEKVCDHWVSGKCSYGDRCRGLHSWSQSNNEFSLVARLEGHKKAVTGIKLPAGSDKLYSGARDGTLRVWDCHTGQCTELVNFGSEIGCLIIEGSWMFLGLPNLVKAFCTGREKEVCLGGPVGQVNAMAIENDMLFAGDQDGAISVWKSRSESHSDSPFELIASLKGHTKPIVSMIVGAGRLYSGSMDGTIRVWDIEKLQFIETLKRHDDVVMSLLCWDQFLLSCSLDQTVHVWASNGKGGLEVVHTHKEEVGILSLCGVMDTENKPILFCSLNDNSVHLYELPSFKSRGKIFARKEVRAIREGPDGLFFTADATGVVSVWKWLAKQAC